MLTDFGRFLRKIRIDCGEIIKDMAEKLDVTASFLSAVETGKKNIPDHWTGAIVKLYNLDENAKKQLEVAAENSVRSVKLNLENLQSGRRETAILFAREFNSIDDDTITRIRTLLKKDGKGGI
jgi:transcriptional regulator with XRE-family HTH domain